MAGKYGPKSAASNLFRGNCCHSIGGVITRSRPRSPIVVVDIVDIAYTYYKVLSRTNLSTTFISSAYTQRLSRTALLLDLSFSATLGVILNAHIVLTYQNIF